MEIQKIFKKAMVDHDIKNYDDLGRLAGVGYARVLRIMQNKPSAKMVDVAAVAEALKVEIKFIRRQQ